MATAAVKIQISVALHCNGRTASEAGHKPACRRKRDEGEGGVDGRRRVKKNLGRRKREASLQHTHAHRCHKHSACCCCSCGEAARSTRASSGITSQFAGGDEQPGKDKFNNFLIVTACKCDTRTEKRKKESIKHDRTDKKLFATTTEQNAKDRQKEKKC